MCVRLKEQLEEGSGVEISDEEKRNNDLLERLLEEEKLNRELTLEAMKRIKTDMVKLKGGQSAAKSYQQKQKRYGSINKKV